MTELNAQGAGLVARSLTETECRAAVRAVLHLGEFVDPEDTYAVLDACGLLDTARDMHAKGPK